MENQSNKSFFQAADKVEVIHSMICLYSDMLAYADQAALQYIVTPADLI
jgi:hypothetical protein